MDDINTIRLNKGVAQFLAGFVFLLLLLLLLLFRL